MMHVDETADMWTEMEQRPIRVKARLCARARHHRATCRACAAICPAGAIDLDRGPSIDFDRCVGCHLCAAVCPTGALAAHSPSDYTLASQFKEGASCGQGPVICACSKYLDTSDQRVLCTTAVGCLGRLDTGLLLYAASFGPHEVRLVEGPCEECSWRMGREIVGTSVERANDVLVALGIRPMIRFVSGLSEAASPAGAAAGGVTRRRFFNLVFRETARLTAIAVDDALEINGADDKNWRQLPIQLPDRAQLLQSAVRRLVEGRTPGQAQVGGVWGALQIGETCNGCGLCATFCPTGALKKVEQDGRAGVTFQASACLRCGLCEDMCPKRALVIQDSVDLWAISAGTIETHLLRDAAAGPGWTEDTRRKILKQLRTP